MRGPRPTPRRDSGLTALTGWGLPAPAVFKGGGRAAKITTREIICGETAATHQNEIRPSATQPPCISRRKKTNNKGDPLLADGRT